MHFSETRQPKLRQVRGFGNMVTVRILSDLHLDVADLQLGECEPVDLFILAGDLGDPRSGAYVRFVDEVSAATRGTVVLVLGNHEHYGSTVHETIEHVRSLVKRWPNVTLLERECLDVEGTDLRVAGTTLWSLIDEEQRCDIGRCVSDFGFIQGWYVEDHVHAHLESVRFLEEEVRRADEDGKRLVIVTHHAPSFRGTCREEHRGSPFSSAYCTALDGMMHPPIVAWVYGHTHHSNDIVVGGGVRLISNQRGLPFEKTGFCLEKTVTL